MMEREKLDALQAHIPEGCRLLIEAGSAYARMRIVWGDGEHPLFKGSARLDVERESLHDALTELLVLLDAPGEII
ncbi:hypothetical protein ACMT4L_07040 [Deinococcus sp. A31D244]|uniref:hypothetical protein n=1 Tax=Deinococcus sp. A31D244 TaxID=3397675 RepID=UPI0039E15A73